MYSNSVLVKRYPSDFEMFPVNEREIWRYAGFCGVPDSDNEELSSLLQVVKDELRNAFSYSVCYLRSFVEVEEGTFKYPFKTKSLDLAKCLKDCNEVIIFAATVGLGVDRYIARNKRFAPTKALLAQAYGAERVECLCNVFCGEIREQVALENSFCTGRFSPGYGDLPLVLQKDIFGILDCNRQIGISLSESCLMTPSKSVTAIMGIGHNGGVI